MQEIKNAIIRDAQIVRDGHGLLTSFIELDFGGGSYQSFGGYCLYLPKLSKHLKLESLAGHFIWRVLEVAGVSEWSELPGRTVRAKADYSKVHAIGHIVNADWFCPTEDFARSVIA